METSQDPNATTQDVLRRLGPATRALGGVLVALYVLGLVLPVGVLSLVPSETLNWYFWNVFTASFTERSFVSLVLDLLTLVLCATELETVWGSAELLKFAAVVSAATGLLTYIIMFVMFATTVSTSPGTAEALWYHTAFGGFVGESAAFMVALKQLMPETELSMLGPLRMKVKHLPMFIILINVFFLVIGAPIESIPFSFIGVWSGWAYLRWFQTRVGSGPAGMPTRGDPSPDFALETLFPEAVQPVLAGFFTALWIATKPIHRCADAPAEAATADPEVGGGNGYRLGTSDDVAAEAVDADTERRRARATAAIEERLQRQQQTPA